MDIFIRRIIELYALHCIMIALSICILRYSLNLKTDHQSLILDSLFLQIISFSFLYGPFSGAI